MSIEMPELFLLCGFIADKILILLLTGWFILLF
jgi:hypothetical protein